jgi:hypothetical protein
MGYEVEFSDGDTYTVTEALYEALTAAALIEDCDDCSSEFSARLVAHPTSDDAATTARALIEATIDRGSRDRL